MPRGSADARLFQARHEPSSVEYPFTGLGKLTSLGFSSGRFADWIAANESALRWMVRGPTNVRLPMWRRIRPKNKK